MDEIEEEYNQEITKAEQGFLENIKNKKDVKESEEIYRQAIKKAREKYGGAYKKYLAEQKKEILKKKKNKQKKEKFEHFEFSGADMNFTWWEKKKMNLNVWYFRFKRNVFNFKSRVTPGYFIYLRKKTIISINNFFAFVWQSLIEFIFKIRKIALKIGKGGLHISLKIFGILRKVFLKFYEKIIPKKKKGEKTAEQKKETKEGENK